MMESAEKSNIIGIVIKRILIHMMPMKIQMCATNLTWFRFKNFPHSAISSSRIKRIWIKIAMLWASFLNIRPRSTCPDSIYKFCRAGFAHFGTFPNCIPALTFFSMESFKSYVSFIVPICGKFFATAMAIPLSWRMVCKNTLARKAFFRFPKFCNSQEIYYSTTIPW